MCISDVADIFSKQFYIVETSAYSMNELYFDSSSSSYVRSMFRGFFLEYCLTLLDLGALGIFYHKQIAGVAYELSSFYPGLRLAMPEIDLLQAGISRYDLLEERK